MHPTEDIRQNFGHGLRVERKGKYLYRAFGNVITLQIILENEILGNNDLLKVTST